MATGINAKRIAVKIISEDQQPLVLANGFDHLKEVITGQYGKQLMAN